MNTFGRIFRVSVLGESHGQCAGVLIDGCPPGIKLCEADFLPDLERRKSGAKGTTPRRETDEPRIMSGIMDGKTTGAPVLVLFGNDSQDSSAYSGIRDIPRPGHADFTAMRKFSGMNDPRGGGHFSGRLTLGLVVAGAIAKKMLNKAEFHAELISAGGRNKPEGFEKAIDAAVREKDSIGGIVECRIRGLPIGLGEPFFDSAESLLSHALFSIPGIKGVEFGAGFACAEMKGSLCNDALIEKNGKTRANNSGGINGGITNSNEVVFRIAVKPASSIGKAQKALDIANGKETELKIDGRHDACIALRIPVIAEATSAMVFADLSLLSLAYADRNGTD